MTKLIEVIVLTVTIESQHEVVNPLSYATEIIIEIKQFNSG